MNKKILIIIIAAVTTIILAVGGYFVYSKLQNQSAKNDKKFAAAGEEIVGDSHKNKDERTDEEMAPSLDDKLKPSKKVVKSLQKDNVKLSIEIIRLKQTIAELNNDITDLEEYRSTNERFAPQRVKDEMAEIERQVKDFLLKSEDAERFSVVQIEIMAAASALEYREYIHRNRLMVTKVQRAKVAVEFLPGYAFCIGDGIELAANNSTEFNLVAKKFRGASVFLPSKLKKDLDAVVNPCKNTLRSQLDKGIDIPS